MEIPPLDPEALHVRLSFLTSLLPTCPTHLPLCCALTQTPFHLYSMSLTFPGAAQTPSSPQFPLTAPRARLTLPFLHRTWDSCWES